jgi:hypothetical protein
MKLDESLFSQNSYKNIIQKHNALFIMWPANFFFSSLNYTNITVYITQINLLEMNTEIMVVLVNLRNTQTKTFSVSNQWYG